MACIVLAAIAQGRAQTPDSGLVETAEAHRVQIDVSVVDPRSSSTTSVPGLRKEDFLLRLDGRPIEGEAFSRVEFDEICPVADGAAERGDGLVIDDTPTIVVLADLNYLTIAERHATSRAIRDLANLARKRPLRVKVLAYARRVAELTDRFTSDPAEIERAADQLVQTVTTGPGTGLPVRANENDSKRITNPMPSDEAEDGSRPRDPETVRPAFSFDVRRGTSIGEADPLQQIPLARPGSVPELEIDPRPSLTAIEAILLSHAAIKGRKALVLFTDSWFDLPEEHWLTYAVTPRRAAQGGFMIFGVDARGLGGGAASHSSRLLSFLSTSTGGEFITSAGRLAIAFDRALAQLGCYYLFSVPVGRPSKGDGEHDIDVRLDTKKHPERWGFRVRTVSHVTVIDPQRLRVRRRLAGLMEPGAYRYPEVRLSASYPTGSPPTSVIEVGTVLADLTFTAGREGNTVTARMAIEGVVTDDAGRTVCRIGDGQARTIRSEAQPARFPISLLFLASRCELPGPGSYDVRVVVEDLVAEAIGSARARLEYVLPVPGLATASALRVGRNSGRDFLLEGSAQSGRDVPRDSARRGFVPLAADEPAVPSDRLKLRFVGCGLGGDPLVELVPRASGAQPFSAAVVSLGGQRGSELSCVEYEAIVPEATIVPGDYDFVVSTVTPAGTAAPTKRAIGTVEVRVVPPAGSPGDRPGQKT